MATIERSIEVGVGVATAYRQWMRFEEFPRFMSSVVEVRRLDETRTHWVAETNGQRHEWDAQIVEQRPERVIGWRAVDGTRNGWRVTFAGADGRTRVSVLLVREAAGPGQGETFRLDTRQLEEDLVRFKELVEGLDPDPAPGSRRRTIEPGRSVEDDGTVL